MYKRQGLSWYAHRWMLILAVIGAVAIYSAVQSVAQPKDEDEVEVPEYVGTEICASCHEESHQQLSKSVHGRVLAAGERRGRGHLCEGCHGPGSGHVDDPFAAILTTAAQSQRVKYGDLTQHS